jgi:hypothetical protein
MRLWRVMCLENQFPGMWQRWYRHQAVGLGWPPGDGFKLANVHPTDAGWNRAREALKQVQIGDAIVVALRDHRVGRLGYVTGTAVSDAEWLPLVPPSKDYPSGEMGRRVLVRWDLTVGPESRDLVVALPQNVRFNSGELRPTLGQIRSLTLPQLAGAMNDQANWVGLLTHFDYERALSGYIAAYPHRLEDGLLPHPNERVRERIFKDRTRSDVLLTDREGIPVIVECKQGPPTVEAVRQLRHYMSLLQLETEQQPRGILVHGGSKKLASAVAGEAALSPPIEIVQYSLQVDFNRSA